MAEDLLEIVKDIVIGSGSVTHNEVLRIHFRYLGHGGLVHIGIEGGNKIIAVNEEHLFAVDLFFLNLGRQFNVEFW